MLEKVLDLKKNIDVSNQYIGRYRCTLLIYRIEENIDVFFQSGNPYTTGKWAFTIQNKICITSYKRCCQTNRKSHTLRQNTKEIQYNGHFKISFAPVEKDPRDDLSTCGRYRIPLFLYMYISKRRISTRINEHKRSNMKNQHCLSTKGSHLIWKCWLGKQ